MSTDFSFPHQPVAPRSFGTHDGTFHADEVTACALLLLFDLIERDKIIRTRDPLLLAACDFVCDVGGVYESRSHRFDHHQATYQGLMSSAGLILNYLLESNAIDQGLYHHFNGSIILGVDAHDNGRDLVPKGVCSYSHIIAQYNPIEQEAPSKEQDRAFFVAVDFAYGLLERQWHRYSYVHQCRALVEQAMRDGKDYLLFEKNIPWLESFFELGGEEHPARFLLMPSGPHWKLRAIPPSLLRKMEVRQPLPIAWAGLLEQELAQVCGISGALFCHKGRFISVWQDRESALQALEYILEETPRLHKD